MKKAINTAANTVSNVSVDYLDNDGFDIDDELYTDVPHLVETYKEIMQGVSDNAADYHVS